MPECSPECSSCVFFEPIVVHGEDGEVPETICRRYPPMGNGWPTVLADDWCGEHRMQGDSDV